MVFELVCFLQFSFNLHSDPLPPNVLVFISSLNYAFFFLSGEHHKDHTPADQKFSSVEPGVGRREWEEVRVEPYDEYSRKCQNLQSRYKDLKARAEEAIDKLIRSESDDSYTADQGQGRMKDSFKPELQHQDKLESRSRGDNKTKSEFATPNKSRLSLERSMHETSRLSSSGGGDKWTGSDISRSSSAASGRDSGHEFLKYHAPNISGGGGNGQVPDKPSNYRGPEYWSNIVQQNYSEMAKPKTSNVIGQPVSHDQELRIIQRTEQERAARLSAGR